MLFFNTFGRTEADSNHLLGDSALLLKSYFVAPNVLFAPIS